MDMARWQGKVALVTGASSGIGEAVALALAEDGMKVALCARRAERLEALAAKIKAAGGEALATPADLRDMAQIDATVAAIKARWGQLDVLINNAGLGIDASLIDGDPEAWRTMQDVNVLALAAFTAHAVRDMRARDDRGHVIHISSMAGHRIPPGGGGFYAGTKFAVRAMTEALRLELRELKSNIRVSAISPGVVETEFAQVYHGDPDLAAQHYSRFEAIQVEDIAQTVRHVLSTPERTQIHDVLLRPTAQFY